MQKPRWSPNKNLAATISAAALLMALLSSNAWTQQLTSAQWREDLRYLAEQMARTHKQLYAYVSKQDFDAAVARLDKRIPSLTREQMLVELDRLTALVRDGHTTMPYFRSWDTQPKPLLPIELYLFSDGLFITRADPSVKQLLGARVVKIGALSVDEALERVAQIDPHENEFEAKMRVPHLLRMTEVLAALGLSQGPDRASFEIEQNGRRQVVMLTARIATPSQFEWLDAQPDNKPLWSKHPDEPYWFEYLEAQKVLYLQLNRMTSKPNDPLDKFLQRVLDFSVAHPVDKLVLDLRLNGGGNNYFTRAVLVGLIKSKLNQRGKFFCIIGRGTFSAAMNLTNELERWTETTFVGEPTGQRTNFYADPVSIVAPNSKLVVTVSTLWWQDQGPRDARPYIVPQLAAELTAADYKAGRDPALEAVLNYQEESSIYAIARQHIRDRDLEGARKAVADYLKNPLHKYLSAEGALYGLGYEFIGAKEFEAAVQVFTLDAEFYPRSAKVWEGLGDSYAAKGDRGLAINSYEQSLTLDPHSISVQSALKRLSQSK